jgi:hypothetical protein
MLSVGLLEQYLSETCHLHFAYLISDLVFFVVTSVFVMAVYKTENEVNFHYLLKYLRHIVNQIQ